MALATLNYGCESLESPTIWINEDIAASPPLELPSYLKDRIESRKRRIWESKIANISMADAKRKALINGRVRRLSDQADHVKRTVKENQEQQKQQAQITIQRMKKRLSKAECKRTRRLNSISVRCKQKVADAKMRRLENIQRLQEQQEKRLDAINEKLAAGIARRNTELRNRKMRSLAACRWCAARKIQVWWHVVTLKKRVTEFLNVAPGELLGTKEPKSYYDLRRILISRNNIRATTALLQSVFRFNEGWARNAAPRILLTCFMIKYFPRSVLAYDGDLERSLIEKGEDLVTTFRQLINHPNAYYRILHQKVLAFGVVWGQYVTALEHWKSVDIERLMAELRRYWDQLQEVKEAMTARAENAGSSDLPGSVEEADDSHAVLSHVQSQEQMVLDRVIEIGGQVALKEFKESIGASDRSDNPAPAAAAPTPRRTLARTPPPSPRPTAPLPDISTPPQVEEEMCSHGVEEEVDEEVPGPSDEFYESMSKMEMAHEIVMNDKYQIERQQPQGLQGQVESTLKAAYWDIVREEVSREEYGQCVEMLGQIRLNIEGIGTIEKLPPTHHFRQLISGELDTELIKQQIEHNAFNLNQKIEAVVSILLKLCSAAQDEEIKAISRLTDVPTIFKSIFEAIDAIKLEIANFYLEQTKQKIRENSVEYEKAKFAEFLEVHPSGLDRTREWIRGSHSDGGPLATMCNAYLKLLAVDPPLPETTALDQERYAKLGHNTRFTLLISLLSIRLSSLHEDLSEPSFLSSLLSTLRILAPEGTNPADAADLIQAKTTDMVLSKVPRLPRDTVEDKVSGCLDSVIRGKAQDPVLDLLTRRLHGYLTERSLNRKAEVPKNLLGDVEGMGDQYHKLVHYNRQVYGSHYAAILKPPSQ